MSEDKRTESAEYWERERRKALSEAELCKLKAVRCLVKRNYHYIYPFFEGEKIRCIKGTITAQVGQVYVLSIDNSTGKIMLTPIKKDGTPSVRSCEYVVIYPKADSITDYFEKVYDVEG